MRLTLNHGLSQSIHRYSDKDTGIFRLMLNRCLRTCHSKEHSSIIENRIYIEKRLETNFKRTPVYPKTRPLLERIFEGNNQLFITAVH